MAAEEEQATEEGVDSELLVADSGVDGSDLLDELATATNTQADDDLDLLLPATPGAEALAAIVPTEGGPEEEEEEGRAVVVVLVEQAVQTDLVPSSPAVSELIQYMLQLQDPAAWRPASPSESTESFPESISALMADLTPKNPHSAVLLSPVETPGATVQTQATADGFMQELDFAGCTEERLGERGRRYWSRSFLVDLLAVAAPVVPTALWAISTQRGGTGPVYNIGALLRGCCVLALHSLRRTACHAQA